MATKPAKPRERRTPGRPRGTGKLTPLLQERVCALLRKALPRNATCDRAGIDYSTFHRWLVQGEEQESGPYRNFRNAVMEAESSLYQEVTEDFTGIMLSKSVDPGTRLNAQKFYLSHRHPQDWSTKSTVAQTGPDGGPVQVAVTATIAPVLSDEMLSALGGDGLAALAKLLA